METLLEIAKRLGIKPNPKMTIDEYRALATRIGKELVAKYGSEDVTVKKNYNVSDLADAVYDVAKYVNRSYSEQYNDNVELMWEPSQQKEVSVFGQHGGTFVWHDAKDSKMKTQERLMLDVEMDSPHFAKMIEKLDEFIVKYHAGFKVPGEVPPTRDSRRCDTMNIYFPYEITPSCVRELYEIVKPCLSKKYHDRLAGNEVYDGGKVIKGMKICAEPDSRKDNFSLIREKLNLVFARVDKDFPGSGVAYAVSRSPYLLKDTDSSSVGQMEGRFQEVDLIYYLLGKEGQSPFGHGNRWGEEDLKIWDRHLDIQDDDPPYTKVTNAAGDSYTERLHQDGTPEYRVYETKGQKIIVHSEPHRELKTMEKQKDGQKVVYKEMSADGVMVYRSISDGKRGLALNYDGKKLASYKYANGTDQIASEDSVGYYPNMTLDGVFYQYKPDQKKWSVYGKDGKWARDMSASEGRKLTKRFNELLAEMKAMQFEEIPTNFPKVLDTPKKSAKIKEKVSKKDKTVVNKPKQKEHKMANKNEKVQNAEWVGPDKIESEPVVSKDKKHTQKTSYYPKDNALIIEETDYTKGVNTKRGLEYATLIDLNLKRKVTHRRLGGTERWDEGVWETLSPRELTLYKKQMERAEARWRAEQAEEVAKKETKETKTTTKTTKVATEQPEIDYYGRGVADAMRAMGRSGWGENPTPIDLGKLTPEQRAAYHRGLGVVASYVQGIGAKTGGKQPQVKTTVKQNKVEIDQYGRIRNPNYNPNAAARAQAAAKKRTGLPDGFDPKSMTFNETTPKKDTIQVPDLTKLLYPYQGTLTYSTQRASELLEKLHEAFGDAMDTHPILKAVKKAYGTGKADDRAKLMKELNRMVKTVADAKLATKIAHEAEEGMPFDVPRIERVKKNTQKKAVDTPTQEETKVRTKVTEDKTPGKKKKRLMRKPLSGKTGKQKIVREVVEDMDPNGRVVRRTVSDIVLGYRKGMPATKYSYEQVLKDGKWHDVLPDGYGKKVMGPDVREMLFTEQDGGEHLHVARGETLNEAQTKFYEDVFAEQKKKTAQRNADKEDVQYEYSKDPNAKTVTKIVDVAVRGSNGNLYYKRTVTEYHVSVQEGEKYFGKAFTHEELLDANKNVIDSRVGADARHGTRGIKATAQSLDSKGNASLISYMSDKEINFYTSMWDNKSGNKHGPENTGPQDDDHGPGDDGHGDDRGHGKGPRIDVTNVTINQGDKGPRNITINQDNRDQRHIDNRDQRHIDNRDQRHIDNRTTINMIGTQTGKGGKTEEKRSIWRRLFPWLLPVVVSVAAYFGAKTGKDTAVPLDNKAPIDAPANIGGDHGDDIRQQLNITEIDQTNITNNVQINLIEKAKSLGFSIIQNNDGTYSYAPGWRKLVTKENKAEWEALSHELSLHNAAILNALADQDQNTGSETLDTTAPDQTPEGETLDRNVPTPTPERENLDRTAPEQITGEKEPDISAPEHVQNPAPEKVANDGGHTLRDRFEKDTNIPEGAVVINGMTITKNTLLPIDLYTQVLRGKRVTDGMENVRIPCVMRAGDLIPDGHDFNAEDLMNTLHHLANGDWVVQKTVGFKKPHYRKQDLQGTISASIVGLNRNTGLPKKDGITLYGPNRIKELKRLGADVRDGFFEKTHLPMPEAPEGFKPTQPLFQRTNGSRN